MLVKKITFLICLSLALFSCKSRYEKGYDDGFDEGHAEGYAETYDGAYQNGVADGRVEGQDLGYNAGHYQGYEQGYQNSRDDFASADYLSGYSDGYDSGYDDNFLVGQADGAQDGKFDGKEDGYNDGYDDGHYSGYNSGYDEGYDDGYSSGYYYAGGYSDGYDSGYDSGYSDGSSDYESDYGDAMGSSLKSNNPSVKLAAMVNSDLIDYTKLQKFNSNSALERGSIVFSHADSGSVDMEKLAALKEKHYLNQISMQLQATYSLDRDAASKIARVAHQFNKVSGSRNMSEKDAKAFSKELVGFDLALVRGAVKDSMKGNSSKLNELMNKASKTMGTSPEQLNKMILKIFN